MREIQLTRGPVKWEELWQQGKLCGVKVGCAYFHGDIQISAEDSYMLPEDDQMWAEDWMAQKHVLAQGLMNLALEETNLEYHLLKSVVDYIEALPPE